MDNNTNLEEAIKKLREQFYHVHSKMEQKITSKEVSKILEEQQKLVKELQNLTNMLKTNQIQINRLQDLLIKNFMEKSLFFMFIVISFVPYILSLYLEVWF